MPDKNAELVVDAISRNVAIVLSLPSAGMLRNHKTRFLCELEHGILVQAPRGEHALIEELIKNRTLCGVAFANRAFNLVFESPILREERGWRLNEATKVNGLLLEFPAEIKAAQRRSNYRVDVSPDSEISVRVWRLGDGDYFKEQPSFTKEVTAEIRDLSSGGVGVRLIGKDGARPIISPEDRLRVALAYNGQTLIMEGKMRRPAAAPRGDAIVTGIQFKKLESDLEGRQTLAHLIRIVGELQRADLRRMRLGLAKKKAL
ncbi:MAG TPA: PilZ domain-containing protein [Tepidisphaeraceae bacterium]|jgi:c-di-GMP-binding flagellar brake protein YcgR|nr:PilZ domain-containing protein [Tepidisphaeraceae bacterium]